MNTENYDSGMKRPDSLLNQSLCVKDKGWKLKNLLEKEFGTLEGCKSDSELLLDKNKPKVLEEIRKNLEVIDRVLEECINIIEQLVISKLK